MSAFVTDQFRIFNAGNFVDSVLDTNNSYYVFLGLSNPTSPSPGFGRTSTWNDAAGPPNPIDNFSYESQYGSTSLFGKRVVGDNIRRVIRKVEWTKNTYYDMYKHDYDINNKAPNSGTGRLYDANYFVVNSDYNVYICIENGSSGVSGTTTSKGNQSEDEPTFTDLEPSAAGTSNDGYIWKFLFTISPSDIVKFDSTEYIVVPNNWATSTNSQIQSVREAGDSTLNLNQIKTVYIEDGGKGYAANTTTTVDIIGDGTGAKASVTSDGNGTITDIVVTAGGSGYSYGMVNLGAFGQPTGGFPAGSVTAIPAKLIPIIPPSRGHGYDIYKELGADRVLVYARFDDSTKDFPTDTKFAQVGIVRNPSTYTSENTIFTGSQYSSLGAIKILDYSTWDSTNLSIGSTITQVLPDNAGTAKGYVASYDKQSGVLKYYQDRSLYYEQTNNRNNQTDYIGVGSDANSKQLAFGTSGSIKFLSTPKPSDASVSVAFTGSTMVDGTKEVDLGVYFTSGLANPEINKTTGDVIYIDNRKEVTRDSRQKEDIKIVLEF
tara:strand:+ start:2183 stop:3820 length:1638 start_codon:yes stop_codon:yes gene_type:complete